MEITPQEVKQRLDSGENLRLIDVREPHEYAIAHIESGELMPMRTIPAKLEQLASSNLPLIVFCHHGVRSLHVVQFLRDHGIQECYSMRGGIDAWSLTIDPGIPRY